MDIKGYIRACGTRIIPGTKNYMYGICAEEIATWPDFKTTSGVGDSITLDGDIVLKAGKTFAKVEIIPNTGKVMHTGVGVITSKGYDNSYDFKLPKDIGADEWSNENINSCGIWLVPQKDGKIRVIGNPDCPAQFESAVGDGGDNSASEASWVHKIADMCGQVAPYYEGVIDLTA